MKHTNKSCDLLQGYYRITMTVLRVVYSTADCMSLQLGTVTTVTTDFVGKSHGLLMQAQPLCALGTRRDTIIWLMHVNFIQGRSEYRILFRQDRGKCAVQGFKLRSTSLICRYYRRSHIHSSPPLRCIFSHPPLLWIFKFMCRRKVIIRSIYSILNHR